MLPLIMRRLGFDPASASAPFVATLVDVTGLVIYFTMASVILHGTCCDPGLRSVPCHGSSFSWHSALSLGRLLERCKYIMNGGVGDTSSTRSLKE